MEKDASIMVTGARGLVGSAFVELLESKATLVSFLSEDMNDLVSKSKHEFFRTSSRTTYSILLLGVWNYGK